MYKLYSNAAIVSEECHFTIDSIEEVVALNRYIEYLNFCSLEESKLLETNRLIRKKNLGLFFINVGLDIALPIYTLISNIKGKILVVSSCLIGMTSISRVLIKKIKENDKKTLESKLAIKVYSNFLEKENCKLCRMAVGQTIFEVDNSFDSIKEDSIFQNYVNKLKRKREIITKYVKNKTEFNKCYNNGTLIDVLSNKYGYNFSEISFLYDLINMEKSLCCETKKKEYQKKVDINIFSC